MRQRLIAAIIIASLSLLALIVLALMPAEPTMAELTETTIFTTETEAVSVPETEAETMPEITLPKDPIQELLDSMTLEEKAGQIFLARCPGVTAPEDAAAYHLGGYILFGQDTDGRTPETLRTFLQSCQSAAKLPLLIAVDEEGGTVCRISDHTAFRSQRFSSPRNLYQRGGMELVLSAEREKAQLLHGLGINVNMAPVCDIATKSNAFMYSRSLGTDARTVGEFAAGAITVMAENGVGAVMKHFPGYGNNSDTHTGIAVDRRSLEELEKNDLQPFFAGIQAGGGAILVSHTIVEALDSAKPASLSPEVHRYLRLAMDFGGVIVTDDLAMEAITKQYGAGESAVLAVLAGNDLLCSTEYRTQYAAVLEACQQGRIPEAALNSAVEHVLRWKQQLGLL